MVPLLIVRHQPLDTCDLMAMFVAQLGCPSVFAIRPVSPLTLSPFGAIVAVGGFVSGAYTSDCGGDHNQRGDQLSALPVPAEGWQIPQPVRPVSGAFAGAHTGLVDRAPYVTTATLGTLEPVTELHASAHEQGRPHQHFGDASGCGWPRGARRCELGSRRDVHCLRCERAHQKSGVALSCALGAT